jgi:LacI family transcriptional regulator
MQEYMRGATGYQLHKDTSLTPLSQSMIIKQHPYHRRQVVVQKTITINDIAERAGVSASTVSRVLNGSKRVNEETRALVMAAVEHYQYRPSAIAQGLARGRSMTIGVLVQNITNPFFGEVLTGVEKALEHTAYLPIFASTHWYTTSKNEEVRALHALIERRVDGLLVIGGHIPEETVRETAAEIPLITIGRRIGGLEEQSVFIDNEEGAYRITRYLIGLNHTQIAHITGYSDHPDSIERLRGYRRALTEANLSADPALVIEGQFTEASGLAATEQLLGRGVRFSALVAASDQLAYGAMSGLSTHGFRIPADVSVVGFDDISHSAYTLPPLTTVRQPVSDMGRAGAEALFRMLEGRSPDLPNFTTELVIRKSAIHNRRDDS